MKQQWLMSTERSVRAGAAVCAAAVLLVSTLGAGGTAETTRSSRLHHASAGHAQAAVPATPAKPANAKSGSSKSSAKSKSAPPNKPSAAKKSEAKPPVASKTRPQSRRKKKSEPEEVAEPFPQHIVRGEKPAHGVPAQQNAFHKEAPRANETARVEPSPRIESSHGLPATPPTQLPESATPAMHASAALPTGVSHPEQDEPAVDETPAAPVVRSTPEPNDNEEAAVAPVVAPAHELAASVASVAPLREEYPLTPVITSQPELTYRNGRVVVPAPLKGSHEVLVHQNLMADGEHLDRIQDDEELEQLIAHRQLVNFPETPGLRLNPELPGERRVARVWTVRFVEDMARNFYERFHQPLTVSSAVRTIAYQMRLERVNGNAAGIDGDSASPHLTGQAVDIAKRGMSAAQLAWMRSYLTPVMQAGNIDVEEEFKQACFHISVYKNYLPAKNRMEVAKLSK